MKMLTFCVETTYFGMGSDIYRQDERLAIGSPLSPVLTNIWMEFFEEMALGSSSQKPFMWLRYGDDLYILLPHQEDVQTLLHHVNSIRPSIQLTMKKEQDNKLPFLDVLVQSKDSGHPYIVSPPLPDSNSISTPIIHIMRRKESSVAYNIEQKPFVVILIYIKKKWLF